MAQKNPRNQTAEQLSNTMLSLFDKLVDRQISLDEAKVIQNHSAKIMTINMGQLMHDKFVGIKTPIAFFAR